MCWMDHRRGALVHVRDSEPPLTGHLVHSTNPRWRSPETSFPAHPGDPAHNQAKDNLRVAECLERMIAKRVAAVAATVHDDRHDDVIGRSWSRLKPAPAQRPRARRRSRRLPEGVYTTTR